MTEDGSIVISTKIRTDGIKAGTAEIEAGVHRAADRVNTLGSNVKKTLNNQIDSFVKLNDEYSTQEQKVESLRQKVAAYANQRIPTAEYKEITAQIEQAQEKLNRLNDAKERFGATGGKVNSTSYKKMQYDIEDLANVIKYAKSELDDLEASGKAFISGVNTKEAQADMEKLTAAEKKLSDMQKQLHTSYQSIADTYNSYLNKLLENERKNERKIAEINGKLEETRAKEVEAAVEANRLKAIGDSAKVGSKRIVNLNSELERLQARQGIEVLLSTVKGIFNSIKQIFSGFITFLKGAFTGNIDMALKGVLGILRGSANLISSIFKTPVNEVIALFNAMGQAVVKGINNLIDGLNHIKVPDWVPGIGGKGIDLSHANFTRVPYLAQGAVIPAGNPFLAVLGDQTRGNNLEMPENLLRKIVSEESGKGTGMIKLVVNLDSRTVLEQLINTAKEMQMSNGQNVFELGR